MINQALIEKHFSNKLSKEELDEFNALYKNNNEFKAEVDFLKNVKLVSEKEDVKQFKKQLKNFELELINKKPLVKWLKPLTAIAAVLTIAFSIYFIFNRTINEDQLFSEYFAPSSNVSAPIVRSDNVTLYNNAFIAYGNSNYQEALTLFENTYLISKNSELLFYKGNVLLALGNTTEAIAVFKKHLLYSDILTNRSHWYLALAYLKSKKIEFAKQELNALINSGERFKQKEAKELLKKLN
jgi:tetratricopeptide (TPR) repeat protein